MNTVFEFCKKYGFQEECTLFLSEAYLKLRQYPNEFREFCEYVKSYEMDYSYDTTGLFDKIENLSKTVPIHKYTLDLLYLILLTPHLKKLYAKNGFAEDIYDDSVLDLKWKACECYEVYGVWGTFVAWWTIGFFKLKRFAIGRLQFNLRNFAEDMSNGELSFKKGDLYIDTHIPSCGRLNIEECHASYRRASRFFRKDFYGKDVVFGCHSWLLSKNNRKILPESSNILAFMDDYTVLKEEKDPDNANLWRIFGTFYLPEDPENLPQKTSLQRAFVGWLKSGNTIDSAFGVIVLKGNFYV